MIIKKNKNIKQEETVVEEQIEQASSQELTSEIVFDINEIDFNARTERRRGDRRRGYRRIDDRSLVSRAQKEAITIKENAREEGYQMGLSQAAEDIAKLDDAINDFLSAKDKIYEEVSEKILEISLEVAKKIIKTEVETNPDVMKGIIINALDKLTKNEKQIVLRVSPFDKEYVKNNIESIIEQLQIEAKVTIQQDKNLAEGSVVVETNNGLIDASIDTGIHVVEQMFKQMQGDK